jgi:hypothetical protein
VFSAVGPGLPWQQRFDLVTDNKITLGYVTPFVLDFSKNVWRHGSDTGWVVLSCCTPI